VTARRINVSDRHEVIDLSDTALLTDDDLVGRARDGDRRAFGTLYLRHRDAAWRVACASAVSTADAEDAVAEGFAKVFAALPRMMGRDIAFRAYLLACVRNCAIDRHRRDRHVDRSAAVPDRPGVSGRPDESALLDLERNLVGEALQSLPERWRTVLWLTEVEGMTPAEVSGVLGIKPNAVAALSYRAREGLREAYLQAHLRAEAPAECRWTVDRLGNYVRGELADRDRLRVQTHLDDCIDCRRRRDELADVNATLRSALVPVPLMLGAVAQRKWLSVSHLGKGTRTVKPPAKAAKAGQVVNSTTVKGTVAGLSVFVIALGSGMAIRGFEKAAPRTVAAPATTPPNIPTEVDATQLFRPDATPNTVTPIASVGRRGRTTFHTPEPAGTPSGHIDPPSKPTTDPTPPPPPPPPTKPTLAVGASAPNVARGLVSVGSSAGTVVGANVAGTPVLQDPPPQRELLCVTVLGNQTCSPA
jgi:RNA polymerase sigma factor (sigma-70 family)